MALRSQELAGNARLEQAALGPPSLKPQPSLEDPDAVARVQRGLVRLGLLPSEFGDTVGAGDVWGMFGRQTVAAVKAFQQRAFPNRIDQWDGVVGKGTLGKLDAALAAPGPAPGPTPPGPAPAGPELEQTRMPADTASASFGYEPVEALSVSPPAPPGSTFRKTVTTAPIRRWMFRAQRDGKTYWIGAACSDTLTHFDEAHVFFHPAPGQAGLADANYGSWSGGWDNVYRYVPWLGSQSAQSGREQVVIVPFMAGSMFSTGGFLAGDPIGRIQEVLDAVRTAMTDTLPAAALSDARLSRLGASSFSVGISALANFCASSGGSGLISEVFDFDGLSSNSPHAGMTAPAGARFRRYSQGAQGHNLVFAPAPRWAAWTPKQKSFGDVHALMPNLLLHALST